MFLLRKHSHNHQENDTAQQDAKVSELKAALGPQSGRSLKYCTDACLRRYLEARTGMSTRRTKCWKRHSSGGQLTSPKKSAGMKYHMKARQNTNCAEENIRHLVYLIENSVLNLGEGQEQMSWLIDFIGLSLSNSISARTARDIINILQNHYPERLAIAFQYNPPRIFEAFWKVVKYFLDPKTFQKVKFVYPKNKDSVELMSSLFDIDNLPCEFGGKATMNYDHEEFSRFMAEDDIKTAKYWGFYEKPSQIGYGHLGAQVALEPTPRAPPAS